MSCLDLRVTRVSAMDNLDTVESSHQTDCRPVRGEWSAGPHDKRHGMLLLAISVQNEGPNAAGDQALRERLGTKQTQTVFRVA